MLLHKVEFHKHALNRSHKLFMVFMYHKCYVCKTQVTDKTVVCSEHFVGDDYMTSLFNKCQRLKPTAKPSVFKWTVDKKRWSTPADRSAFSCVTAKKLKLVSG